MTVGPGKIRYTVPILYTHAESGFDADAFARRAWALVDAYTHGHGRFDPAVEVNPHVQTWRGPAWYWREASRQWLASLTMILDLDAPIDQRDLDAMVARAFKEAGAGRQVDDARLSLQIRDGSTPLGAIGAERPEVVYMGRETLDTDPWQPPFRLVGPLERWRHTTVVQPRRTPTPPQPPAQPPSSPRPPSPSAAPTRPPVPAPRPAFTPGTAAGPVGVAEGVVLPIVFAGTVLAGFLWLAKGERPMPRRHGMAR